MSKNFNLTKWMREKHPEILAEFEALKREHRRNIQREYARKNYEIIKKVRAQQI